MEEPIKIHPLDLASIINQRERDGLADLYQRGPGYEIVIDGRVYVQDIGVPRTTSDIQ